MTVYHIYSIQTNKTNNPLGTIESTCKPLKKKDSVPLKEKYGQLLKNRCMLAKNHNKTIKYKTMRTAKGNYMMKKGSYVN